MRNKTLKQMYSEILVKFLVTVILVLSLISCNTAGQTIIVSYTTPFVPVTFSIDSNGNISVNATANFATEIGDFAVTVVSSVATVPAPANSIALTIRHKQNGQLFDAVYQLNTGKAGSAVVQGNNISEVKVAWNGDSNSIFIDASNGDITSIEIQGTASGSTPIASTPIISTNTPAVPIPTPAPLPTSKPAPTCPGVAQVSEWMGISVSQVPFDDLCAFYAINHGHPLKGVNCTNLAGGTTIEYNTVDAPTTLIIKSCDGKPLPDMYQFTIRFVKAYPAGEASVCSVAAQAPAHFPSNWTMQAEAHC